MVALQCGWIAVKVEVILRRSKQLFNTKGNTFNWYYARDLFTHCSQKLLTNKTCSLIAMVWWTYGPLLCTISSNRSHHPIIQIIIYYSFTNIFDTSYYVRSIHEERNVGPILEWRLITQCKNSWNSCQDLAYSYIFPFTLETLDKISFFLASHKPLGFLDSIPGKSLIKSVKRMNSCKTNINFVHKYSAVVRTTSYTIIL